MPNDRVTMASTDTGKGSRPVYTCTAVYGWSRDVRITLAPTDTLTRGETSIFRCTGIYEWSSDARVTMASTDTLTKVVARPV